jgi:hypothetical protein
MAAATYTTDLVTISAAEATTGYAEPTGSTAGGTPSLENEYFIQGSNCISKSFNATGVGGLAFTAGTGQTLPTDGAAYIWAYFAAPNAMNTKANGGKQILIGSAIGNYRRYYVSGSDTYEYGGWVCYPVNPTITASATQGTPTTTYVTFGYAANLILGISRGNPLGLDVQRIGRGSIEIVGGDLANGYATFLAAAAENDLVANRWGILSLVDANYKFQGRLLMGTSTTAVDFRDSNKNITIQNTEFVTSNFNLFEVQNASSIVQWTGVSIISLSSVARGNFLVTDNAAVTLSGCTFTDLGTFTFLSATTASDCVFRRCSTITHGNATFTNNRVTNSVATSAVVSANPSSIENCTFVSAGTGHGLEITAAGTYTLSGNTFTGYGATGTTDAAVYNSSGGLVTLNISGGGTVVTFRNSAGSSTVVNASANVTITGLVADSEVRAYLGTNPATATELAGTESSGTSFNFAQSVGGQAGYIQIFHVEYQPIFLEITYGTSDAEIPVQQIFDRQYDRGTTFSPG